MIFKKKKGMVDVRELQRRGVVRIPKKDIVIPTDNNGFVEFGATNKQLSPQSSEESSTSNADFFGFMNSSSTPSQNSQSQISRAESQRITDLDNKIYKLEQRIELLERKVGVGKSNDSNVGIMGW